MNLIADGRLNLKLLHRLEQKPPLFSEGDIVFWTDPYISAHVLEAHLDPESDDASRRPETIEGTAAFIAGRYPPVEYPRLLDLGSGPGLYCERFHDAGYRVSGIDFSAASIEYARDQARLAGRSIDYRKLDYRGWEPEENAFDLITMIFGDFCVLSPVERDGLLINIRRALRPGGLFLFDCFTELYLPGPDERAWYTMLYDGFWREEENLVLELKHRYPEERVHLNRYLIITADGEVKSSHIWHRWYERAELRSVLKEAGFELDGMWGDLAGAPLQPSPEWFGVAARPVEGA